MNEPTNDTRVDQEPQEPPSSHFGLAFASCLGAVLLLVAGVHLGTTAGVFLGVTLAIVLGAALIVASLAGPFHEALSSVRDLLFAFCGVAALVLVLAISSNVYTAGGVVLSVTELAVFLAFGMAIVAVGETEGLSVGTIRGFGIVAVVAGLVILLLGAIDVESLLRPAVAKHLVGEPPAELKGAEEVKIAQLLNEIASWILWIGPVCIGIALLVAAKTWPAALAMQGLGLCWWFLVISFGLVVGLAAFTAIGDYHPERAGILRFLMRSREEYAKSQLLAAAGIVGGYGAFVSWVYLGAIGLGRTAQRVLDLDSEKSKQAVCPECQTAVRDKALLCRNCGFPMEQA